MNQPALIGTHYNVKNPACTDKFTLSCSLTDDELTVDGEGVAVVRELCPQRSYDRQTGGVVLVERSVPERQERVAQAQGVPHHRQRLRIVQPRLTPLRVQVWVRPEKRQEHTRLQTAFTSWVINFELFSLLASCQQFEVTRILA